MYEGFNVESKNESNNVEDSKGLSKKFRCHSVRKIEQVALTGAMMMGFGSVVDTHNRWTSLVISFKVMSVIACSYFIYVHILQNITFKAYVW